MQYLVMAATSLAYDADRPIGHVATLGVAGSDTAAISLIARHYAEHARTTYDALTSAPSRLPVGNRIWILRGGGIRGDEITGGVHGTTLYRAVPLKAGGPL